MFPKLRKGILIAAGVFLAAIVAEAIFAGGPPPTEPGGYADVASCKRAALDRLKAPATADFAPAGEWSHGKRADGALFVRGWVDAENGFGAKLRSDVVCTFDYPTGQGGRRRVRAEILSR